MHRKTKSPLKLGGGGGLTVKLIATVTAVRLRSRLDYARYFGASQAVSMSIAPPIGIPHGRRFSFRVGMPLCEELNLCYNLNVVAIGKAVRIAPAPGPFDMAQCFT